MDAAPLTAADLPAVPLPPMVGLVGEYYAWHQQRQLRLQRCDACGRWAHPPRHACPSCGQGPLSWTQVSGLGEVFTWTVTHQPLHRAFEGRTPYASVVVHLDEGPKIMSMVLDVPPDRLFVGQRVRAVFPVIDEHSRLVMFQPAD